MVTTSPDRHTIGVTILRLALLSLALTAVGCPDSDEGNANPADATTPETSAPDVTADSAPPPQACVPGVTQNYCPTATSILRCDATGTLWEEVTCPDDRYCFGGQCTDAPCPPGAVTCSDNKTLSACLALPGGGFEWSPINTCSGACNNGACVDVCGFDPKPNIIEACEHFVLDLEGTPDNACAEENLLAVPSSASDQIAVFDVSGNTPVAQLGTPFSTCDDPSRILVDRSANIVATCRGDGQVYKHAKDGTLLWGVELPQCTAVRGAVIGPEDRLFVGCTSTRDVHELDPDTGAILDTLQTGIDIYGMAVDGTGIYVTDFGNLMKISVLAGMSAVWKVSASGYGIASDGAGSIWLTEVPGMVQYSATDGSILNTVAVEAPDPWFGAYCNGITVALDGTVYAGCAEGGNFIARYTPATDAVDILTLPESDEHPRGVAVDRNGNLFSINLNSSTVTRFDGVTDEAVSFGLGLLDQPYGYSGDMTGLTSCLFAGETTWLSNVIDLGEPRTWLKVDWKETVPNGTSVTVFYSLDEGPWVQILAGMSIDAVGQTLQLRAVLESSVDDVAPTLHELAVYYE